MSELGGPLEFDIEMLVEGASEALEDSAEKLELALEKGVEGAEGASELVVGAAQELATGVAEAGAEVAESFVEQAIEVIESRGIFDELAEKLGDAWETFYGALETAADKIEQIPPEELARLFTVVILAIYAPELLVENPVLLARLLEGGGVADAIE